MEKNLMGYVSPTEAARILGVSRVRIAQLCQTKRLNYILTPLGKVIDVKSLEAYDSERQNRYVIEYRQACQTAI